jgi:hypothetical protein
MFAKRSSARGVTLVELMATAALISLVAGGFALLVGGKAEDSTEIAVKDAARIKRAADVWRTDNPSGCPSISQLLRDGQLTEASRADDPWGGRYRLMCDGGDVRVISPGVDGRLSTSDDVRYPQKTM